MIGYVAPSQNPKHRANHSCLDQVAASHRSPHGLGYMSDWLESLFGLPGNEAPSSLRDFAFGLVSLISGGREGSCGLRSKRILRNTLTGRTLTAKKGGQYVARCWLTFRVPRNRVKRSNRMRHGLLEILGVGVGVGVGVVVLGRERPPFGLQAGRTNSRPFRAAAQGTRVPQKGVPISHYCAEYLGAQCQDGCDRGGRAGLASATHRQSRLIRSKSAI